jgi:hypothetical protein
MGAKLALFGLMFLAVLSWAFAVVGTIAAWEHKPEDLHKGLALIQEKGVMEEFPGGELGLAQVLAMLPQPDTPCTGGDAKTDAAKSVISKLSSTACSATGTAAAAPLLITGLSSNSEQVADGVTTPDAVKYEAAVEYHAKLSGMAQYGWQEGPTFTGAVAGSGAVVGGTIASAVATYASGITATSTWGDLINAVSLTIPASYTMKSPKDNTEDEWKKAFPQIFGMGKDDSYYNADMELSDDTVSDVMAGTATLPEGMTRSNVETQYCPIEEGDMYEGDTKTMEDNHYNCKTCAESGGAARGLSICAVLLLTAILAGLLFRIFANACKCKCGDKLIKIMLLLESLGCFTFALAAALVMMQCSKGRLDDAPTQTKEMMEKMDIQTRPDLGGIFLVLTAVFSLLVGGLQCAIKPNEEEDK